MWMALLFGVLFVLLQFAYVYALLGPEYFRAMFERIRRDVESGRHDDDDPRGIGGGFA